MATNNALNLPLSGNTGTGNFVGANTPTLITPTLGVASATSINKLTITTPASGSILTIADGKTLTCSNTLTFTGTDSSSVNFGAGGTVAYGTGGVTWNNVSGTTQNAVVNNGYVCSNASSTTVTLPATAAIGAVVGIIAAGAGGFVLAANTGQTIKFGTSTTASAGNLTSSNEYDSLWVICVVANTTWAVLGGPQSSGLTVN